MNGQVNGRLIPGLGTPAEFYLYGAMYFWMILVYCLSMTLGSRAT